MAGEQDGQRVMADVPRRLCLLGAGYSRWE